jgi:hypothetical protein
VPAFIEEEYMEQVTQAPPKAKQDFSLGNTVKIGTAHYRVTGHKPAPNKGEAPIVELVSHDLSRRYEWQPHRGLRVIGAPPKRVRPKGRNKGKGKQAAAGKPGPQKVERMSLWTRVIRAAFARH